MSGLFALLIMAIRIAPIAAALALAACGSGIDATLAGACDRVAARSGSDRNEGTIAKPFHSAQRLADSLRPGQTGCLRSGTYDEMTAGGYVLKFFRGGRSGKPVTVRSFPGERARLKGVVYFPEGSPHVTLRDVDVDGRAPWLRSDTVTVQIMASDVTFEGNDLTNRGLKSCMILGSNSGWGQAVRTRIRRNIIHGCGDPGHGMLDHGIYAENVLDADISGNVFWGNAAYAIHLYPNAQGTRVTRNVMVDNGGGVIFAGEGSRASSRNVVERNVIARSRKDANIARYWGGVVGSGNIARQNCLFGGAGGNIARQVGFAAVGNVVADPKFANPSARDYRPAPGTPCTKVVGADVAYGAGLSASAAASLPPGATPGRTSARVAPGRRA
jgi:hypothetical protein